MTQMPLQTVAESTILVIRVDSLCDLYVYGAEKYRYTHPGDWEDHNKEFLAKLSGIPFR